METVSSNSWALAGGNAGPEVVSGSEKTTSVAESASFWDPHPLLNEQELECIGQATALSGQQQDDGSNAARPNGPTDTRNSRRRRNAAERFVMNVFIPI